MGILEPMELKEGKILMMLMPLTSIQKSDPEDGKLRLHRDPPQMNPARLLKPMRMLVQNEYGSQSQTSSALDSQVAVHDVLNLNTGI